MSRSLVAFLLAALAAFSSFFLPSASFAYGTTPGDTVLVPIYSAPSPFKSSTCGSLQYTVCGTDRGAMCASDAFNGVDVNKVQYTATFDAAYGSYGRCAGSHGGASYTYAFVLKSNNPTLVCNPPKIQGADGGCYCPPGQAPDASGSCVAYTCPNSGTVVPGSEDRTFSLNGPATDNAFCVSGCLVTSSFVMSYTDESGATHQQAAGPIRSTGQACNPQGQGGTQPSLGAAQPGQAPASAPAACPAGQCPGTVNGVSVCAACSGMATGSVTTTSGQSGGTITSTDCSGGTCTTKTGTIDAKGNVTWTTSTTGSGQNASNTPAGGTGATGTGSGASQNQDQQSFCAENPDSIICKSSSWGGTCGSFTCSGDAVQCQIAKMQADMWCGTSQLPDGIQGKYDALTGEGQAPASFDDKVNLTLPTPEASTCAVQDMQIKFIGGVALNVPLSQMCQWLGYIHTIVVSFGVLMWVFIVFRGK